jgi:hypothetical protein
VNWKGILLSLCHINTSKKLSNISCYRSAHLVHRQTDMISIKNTPNYCMKLIRQLSSCIKQNVRSKTIIAQCRKPVMIPISSPTWDTF